MKQVNSVRVTWNSQARSFAFDKLRSICMAARLARCNSYTSFNGKSYCISIADVFSIFLQIHWISSSYKNQYQIDWVNPSKAWLSFARTHHMHNRPKMIWITHGNSPHVPPCMTRFSTNWVVCTSQFPVIGGKLTIVISYITIQSMYLNFHFWSIRRHSTSSSILRSWNQLFSHSSLVFPDPTGNDSLDTYDTNSINLHWKKLFYLLLVWLFLTK